MSDIDLLSQVTLEELKNGYVFDSYSQTFHCLICGAAFNKGVIYMKEDTYYEAEKFTSIHIIHEHGSMFDYLLGLDKKLTGLSDLQRSLLKLFYEGNSDNEIVAKLDGGSASTIRNHRFALREKEKQARIFLAIMDLLEQQTAGLKRNGATSRQQQGAEHNRSVAVAGRLSAAEKEYKEAVLACFTEGPEGPLTSFPAKEKRKKLVLQHLLTRFEPTKRYTEQEINQVLGAAYADYVTLRRYMIEYGYMDREPDGSAYWIKTGVKQLSKEKRKELILAYKEMKKPMGIYQLRNKVNGKIFIGSSRNLDGRWNRHQFELNMRMERISELQNDWKQYGEEQFVFEVLEILEERTEGYQDINDELAGMEEKWLTQLQPYGEAGYNIKN